MSSANTGSSIDIGASKTTKSTSDGEKPRRPRVIPTPEPTYEYPFPDRRDINYTVVSIGDQVTVDDLVSFAPSSLSLVGEPFGVGVAELPVNFVVDARQTTQTGILLDLDVSVRFTPVSVEFHHGDGTTRTARTGGRSLEQLGLPQFSATSTSHAYDERGIYTASATVNYRAEIDIGGGWFDIDGILSLDSSSTTIEVYEARTALVDQTCTEDPHGPGC